MSAVTGLSSACLGAFPVVALIAVSVLGTLAVGALIAVVVAIAVGAFVAVVFLGKFDVLVRLYAAAVALSATRKGYGKQQSGGANRA